MNSSFTARWNEPLIEENYERWKRDPQSVDASWSAFFEGFELGFAKPSKNGTQPGSSAASGDTAWQSKVDGLVRAYRTLGHSIAKLDPLGLEQREQPHLTLSALGFTEADLDRDASTPHFRDGSSRTLRELITELEHIYCDTVGTEYMHIQDPAIRDWVREKIENRTEKHLQEPSVHREVLRQVFEAENFENFLHTKYVGSKRFSLEGGESLLVALNALLRGCENHGVREIVMGMAHRGRLNVLANFLNKPLHMIFNEFSDNYVPELGGGNGDVKYHLGYQTTHRFENGHEVEIRLAANPSHLEAVDPVVLGSARARQRILDDTENRKKVLPVLVHGDAAFIGQGIVAEVFNLSQLQGYRVGGTAHIVVNNQIGFTTLPADSRSTKYCTDMAKMVEAPIFHVNGDDLLAVITVAEIALDYRQTFGRDVVLDIYCYRKHGHNEVDEPTFTQPNIYSRIKNHPNPSKVFLKEIAALGTVSTEEAEAIRARTIEELEVALAEVKANEKSKKKTSEFSGSTAIFQPPYTHQPVETKISAEMLEKIVRGLTTIPDGFRILPKLKRILLERRLKAWEAGGPYDWAYGEALAFGSLLLEGTPIRLSGQDSRRGTFTQRLSVLYDEVTRERYIPLMNLDAQQARFCVYNSPLSEAAVLGFDYGYSMDFPSLLCLWEAQFGDFANGAQVIIDQFIASAESKWQRPTSLVMLLPHGYEGQGPEHSSARLERFLELCAEDNMQVCNCTTPAQYFHVLRRQMHRQYRKPLIIMTPKSLLRLEQAVSKTEDFTDSRFFEILADPSNPNPKKVERVVLCSGKVYYDLLNHREAQGLQDKVALVRVEQIYPLHGEMLKSIIQPYTKAKKIVWCQEEPKNMGAWTFILPNLQDLLGQPIHYAGRSASASTAVGHYPVHRNQQAALVKEAIEG